MVIAYDIREREKFKLEQHRWGVIAQLLYEPHRDRKTQPMPSKPWHFFPTGDENEEEDDDQSNELMFAQCQALAVMVDGTIGYDPEFDQRPANQREGISW